MSTIAENNHINGGYILVARKILESEIMSGSPLQRWLFIWFLLKANHKDWNNLKRGQLFTTIDRMREAMTYRIGYRAVKPSRGQIRRAYEGLTKSTMISTMKSIRGMIITIRNYDKYQNPKNYEAHTEEHNESSTTILKGAHYKQECKNKEKEYISSESKDSKQIIVFDKEIEEFQGITEELKERWKQAYPAVDVEIEIERAEQWAASNPNKRKKNWRRFINNWLMRVQEKGGSIKSESLEETPEEKPEPRYVMYEGKLIPLEEAMKRYQQ